MNALLSVLLLPLKLFGLLFRGMALIRIALLVGLLVLAWPYVGDYIKPYLSIDAIKDFFGA